MKYADEVSKFLKGQNFMLMPRGKTRCPCKKCMNAMWDPIDRVERHLFINGTSPLYH